MSTTTYVQHYADGTSETMRRSAKQGRPKSSDPKEVVPLRLHRTTRARIAALGESEQEFIEEAVYAYFVILKSVIH